MSKIVIVVNLLVSLLCAQHYTDMLERSVEIPSASKLVFLGPGALKLGVYLGLQNRLVGIEKIEQEISPLSPYRTFLGKEFIAKLPIIGSGGPGKSPDFEALVVLKPDLIVTSFMDKNVIDLIVSKTGIPVLSLSYGVTYGGNAQQLASIKNSLLLLGKVTQTLSKAEALVTFLNAQEKKLASLNIAPQKIYVGGIGYKGAQGITSTEAAYPPFEMLGLQNCIFEGKNTMGHQFIDLEALVKTNPDIIVIDMFGKERIKEEYEGRNTLFNKISAYQTKKVKEVLAYNFYSTNVENLFLISWQVASIVGVKVDLEQEALDIYKAFYGENGEKLLHKLPYGFGAL